MLYDDHMHTSLRERIAELERQNTDLQTRNTELVEENRYLKVKCNVILGPHWEES